MGMQDWEAVRNALGIEEEQRTVYKVEGRRARLTKDSAIREGLKALAARLQRYEQYLREDSCMKFGEWLRCQAYKREVTW